MNKILNNTFPARIITAFNSLSSDQLVSSFYLFNKTIRAEKDTACYRLYTYIKRKKVWVGTIYFFNDSMRPYFKWEWNFYRRIG